MMNDVNEWVYFSAAGSVAMPNEVISLLSP